MERVRPAARLAEATSWPSVTLKRTASETPLVPLPSLAESSTQAVVAMLANATKAQVACRQWSAT